MNVCRSISFNIFLVRKTCLLYFGEEENTELCHVSSGMNCSFHNPEFHKKKKNGEICLANIDQHCSFTILSFAKKKIYRVMSCKYGLGLLFRNPLFRKNQNKTNKQTNKQQKKKNYRRFLSCEYGLALLLRNPVFRKKKEKK